MTVPPGDRHVTVVTPWYPTQMFPFRGAFVQTMVEATAPGCDSMTIMHCDRWSARVSDAEDAAINRAHLALLPRMKRASSTVGGATLNFLPVPMPVGGDFAFVAKRHADTLHATFAGAPIDAAVVHVHEALPSGWAVLEHLRPETKLFVTEHASFLEQLLDEPEAREMYDKVLDRCEGLFVVGDGTRDVLLKALPRHAEKVSLVANPISFTQPRPEPVTALRRWLFLGGLIPRKGVNWLLEAFAKCHAEDPALTLTIVGDGELGGELRERAEALGVQDVVTFAGSVGPEVALQLMREHDLLVHASRWESFGVTVVEAVAAGMPVLVTRCGGPEETLAGIEEAAGELVAVQEDDASLVEGYRRLRDRFPQGLDLGKAQRVLDERYGYPAVAKMHHRVWFE
ncbi:glycosyltransferase [Actinoplanes sp. ATCC 53533]|uniref:glycosyltransferase n=1 Tax=Actinoplanes sp. ATCC 53533 TaxID=1288362 RepID=UPI001F3E2D78|nr:glycosyltransferase [Actinoplanes sp. ATCC 53533]